MKRVGAASAGSSGLGAAGKSPQGGSRAFGRAPWWGWGRGPASPATSLCPFTTSLPARASCMSWHRRRPFGSHMGPITACGAGAPQGGYELGFGATNHNPNPPPHTHTPKPSGGAHPGAEALKFLFPRSTPPRCRAACPPRRRRGISQPSPDRIKEKYTSKQNRGLLTPDGAAKGAEASPRPGRPGW